MTRPDSAQIASVAGTVGSFIVANWKMLPSWTCAAVGIAYTIWKWRREARSPRRERD